MEVAFLSMKMGIITIMIILPIFIQEESVLMVLIQQQLPPPLLTLFCQELTINP